MHMRLVVLALSLRFPDMLVLVSTIANQQLILIGVDRLKRFLYAYSGKGAAFVNNSVFSRKFSNTPTLARFGGFQVATRSSSFWCHFD